MREKLNENPMAQVALIGVLLVGAVLLLLKPFGGGQKSGEAASGESTATATTVSAPSGLAESLAATPPEGIATAATAATPSSLPAPPLPPRVTAAYDSGKTVVVLIVHDGGIDDRLVARATAGLAVMRDVATFIVPARKIARYTAITERVGVDRVPALLVLRPKRLSHGVPTASVSYGFQEPQSIVQAVVDAGYKGRTLSYHP